MVEDQKIRAAIEADVPFKGTLGGINIRESGPTGAGGRTQRNSDAGQLEPVGQEFSCIKNFPTTGGDQGIVAVGRDLCGKALQV